MKKKEKKLQDKFMKRLKREHIYQHRHQTKSLARNII